MEIGLVASVIQVADAGLKLSSTLYTYVDSVHHADRRIRSLAQDVKLTSSVIEELAQVFKQDRTTVLLKPSALATAKEAVQRCSEVFEEMNTALEKSGKNTLRKLAFPLREQRLELLSANLERLKSTLQLLMQVLAHAQMLGQQPRAQRPAAEAQQRQYIKSLIDAKNRATKKYDEVKRAYDSVMSQLDSLEGSMQTPEPARSALPPKPVSPPDQHLHAHGHILKDRTRARSGILQQFSAFATIPTHEISQVLHADAQNVSSDGARNAPIARDISPVTDKSADRSESMIEPQSAIIYDALTECITHIQTVVGSIERLQHMIKSDPQHPSLNSHTRAIVQTYSGACRMLDKILLGGQSQSLSSSRPDVPPKSLTPAELSYSTPYINLTDPLGRIFRFPWHWCKTESDTRRLIKQALPDTGLIGQLVRDGQYNLFGSDGINVWSQNWDSNVKPGCHLSMHLSAPHTVVKLAFSQYWRQCPCQGLIHVLPTSEIVRPLPLENGSDGFPGTLDHFPSPIPLRSRPASQTESVAYSGTTAVSPTEAGSVTGEAVMGPGSSPSRQSSLIPKQRTLRRTRASVARGVESPEVTRLSVTRNENPRDRRETPASEQLRYSLKKESAAERAAPELSMSSKKDQPWSAAGVGSVPGWKQEAPDERGRKRLHGAFTGGFNAGYFNTVGSKEEWTPDPFMSSRSNRAKDQKKAAEQQPEDFMDEGSLAGANEARKSGIMTSNQASRMRERAVERRAAEDAAFERDFVVVEKRAVEVNCLPAKSPPLPSKRDEGNSSRTREFSVQRGRLGGRILPEPYQRLSHEELGGGVAGNDTLWNLDTDLEHMEGIINIQPPPMLPPVNDIHAGWPGDGYVSAGHKPPDGAAGVWDAPDSWAAKRVGNEDISGLGELDEVGSPPKEEDTGIQSPAMGAPVLPAGTSLYDGAGWGPDNGSSSSRDLFVIGKPVRGHEDRPSLSICIDDTISQHRSSPRMGHGSPAPISFVRPVSFADAELASGQEMTRRDVGERERLTHRGRVGACAEREHPGAVSDLPPPNLPGVHPSSFERSSGIPSAQGVPHVGNIRQNMDLHDADRHRTPVQTGSGEMDAVDELLQEWTTVLD